MNYEYIKENLIYDKNEEEKEVDLIKNIIKTRKELKIANKNFEYASDELIDFYSYQIKAHQAMLNYLIRVAKSKKIEVDMIKDIKYSFTNEEAV